VEIVRSTDGTPLTVYECGCPQAPAVVLVNPIGISLLLLAPLAKALGHNHRIVTWESRALPNWDPSSLDCDTSVEAQLADMARVFAAKQLVVPHLVAYCSGASLAVEALAQGAVTAASLCLVSPSLQLGKDTPRTDYQSKILPLWPRLARQGKTGAAMLRALLAHSDHKHATGREAELDAINTLPFRTDETTLLFAKLLGPWIEIHMASRLARVHTPALILHCEDDPLIHVDSVRAIQRALPSAELILTAAGGHFAVSTSAEMHGAVLSHLASHSVATFTAGGQHRGENHGS
jgi:pimeloyl-ACP methyl ester carboxylesterase